MMNSSATVSAELGLSLVVPEHGSVPLVASLYYSAGDPYAIRMAFHVGSDEPVEWIFARDLLAVGLECPAGEGDVQVWPADDHDKELLNIALSSPFGEPPETRWLRSSPAPTRSLRPATRASTSTSTDNSTSCSGAHRRKCCDYGHAECGMAISRIGGFSRPHGEYFSGFSGDGSRALRQLQAIYIPD